MFEMSQEDQSPRLMAAPSKGSHIVDEEAYNPLFTRDEA